MFKGFVLSESLKNPTVLNRLNKIYVDIEAHSESSSHFWHLFKIKVDDKEIRRIPEMHGIRLEAWGKETVS